MIEMEPLRVLDLFSGIGGFSLGLERTGGFKTIGFCEVLPFRRDVLAKHWPEVPCNEDITTADFTPGQAEVICGGFPCQDISHAGRRAGITGERSGLWRNMVDAIRVVRPQHIIVENVAALLGNGLDSVLGDLAEIGHDAEWHCIPAGAVGAPHIRDRIWIVAHPDSSDDRGEPDAGAIRRSEGASSNQAEGANGKRHRRGLGNSRETPNVADLNQARRTYVSWGATLSQRGWLGAIGDTSRWEVEPAVGRVVDGLPADLDRWRKASIEAYGDTVVPQIPELIGRAILASIADRAPQSKGT